MVVSCDICLKKLSDKRSLKKHNKRFHPEQLQRPEYKCFECHEKHTSLWDIYSHIDKEHKSKLEKLCIYCKVAFASLDSFTKHMESEHGLPVWDDTTAGDMSQMQQPTQSAFQGQVNSYDLSDTHSIDLLEAFLQKKDEVDSIVAAHVHKAPQKVQIRAEVDLSKPGSITHEREKLSIFLNSSHVSVFQDGLAMHEYLEMIDQLVSTLSTFASYGSGWIVDAITGIKVNLVKFSPIRAGSYLALPNELAGDHMRNIFLNIRNHEDHNCFEYCFTAAYHNKYGLQLTAGKESWRVKTSADTYGPTNLLARRPNGEYPMPMGLRDIPKFEKNNNVRVNVFR